MAPQTSPWSDMIRIMFSFAANKLKLGTAILLSFDVIKHSKYIQEILTMDSNGDPPSDSQFTEN